MMLLARYTKAFVFLTLLSTATFAQESLARINCALLFDSSKSVGVNFATVKEAGRAIVEHLRSDDRCLIAQFSVSDEIGAVQEETADKAALLAGIEKLHTEKGGSALVDAVFVTIQEVAKAKGEARGAVIVVTDGDDRGSYYKPKQLFEKLRSSGVRVFTIGIGAKGKGEKLLQRIAEASGGRAFTILSSAELPGVASDIETQARKL